MAEPVDLIIIGGGINGAAIARDAAMRGIKTVLLEKDDFGSGASSKTSKLAHGGVRYLERMQLGLVRESLKERALLLKNAPHLVHPLRFFFPVYTGDPRPLWQINLGMYLYDCLGGRGALPKHGKVKPKDILEQFPALNPKNLEGACTYHDAQMADARIVIENVLGAERSGAVVYNYAPVTGLIIEQGKVKGVSFKNPISGNEESLYAQAIVNATGAWTGQIAQMEPEAAHCAAAPTKGVHLILPKFAGNDALLLHAPQDKRVFFVLPWGEYTMVGTTDTFYSGDPNHVTVELDDIHYLLEAVRHYFPTVEFDKTSVIASFAGLRPLVGSTGEKAPSEITREHVIHKSEGGLITVLGGKYTTYRHIAEQVVDAVIKELDDDDDRILSCATEATPLPGAMGPYTFTEVERVLSAAGLHPETVRHLVGTYGTESMQILKIIQRDYREGERICSKHPHVLAEITYAIEYQHAKCINDWLFRRTSIGYSACGGEECYEASLKKFNKH